MDLGSWMSKWILRHPVRSLSPNEQRRFTDEVMAQVTTEARPSTPPVRVWWTWPRLVLATAVAAAGLVFAIGTIHQLSARQLAERITNETRVLAALNELPADDLESEDLLILAEAPAAAATTADDSTWLAQTMKLLDELGEDAAVDDTSSSSDEELMRELEQLDQNSSASS